VVSSTFREINSQQSLYWIGFWIGPIFRDSGEEKNICPARNRTPVAQHIVPTEFSWLILKIFPKPCLEKTRKCLTLPLLFYLSHLSLAYSII
jgi:hypothetical protein